MPLIDGGLELLTADGALATRLQRAVRSLESEFSVRTRGELDAATLETLRQGRAADAAPLAVRTLEAAGGEFIGQPGATLDAQWPGMQPPEVVIAAWCGAGDRVPLEKIIRDRHWHDLPAAKSGRVYCIRDEFLNTPAPTLIEGLHAVAAAIHPELFPQPAGLRRMAHPHHAERAG